MFPRREDFDSYNVHSGCISLPKREANQCHGAINRDVTDKYVKP